MKNSPFFPKSCRSSFYLKVLFSKVAPNVTNTFGLYCMQNCGQDFSKGGPIWSRCLAFVNFLAYIWSSRAIWLLWSTFRRQKLCQKLFFGNVKKETKSRRSLRRQELWKVALFNSVQSRQRTPLGHGSLYSWCPVWQDWTWPTKENMRLFVCREAVESKPVIAQWYFPPTVNVLWTIWWKLLLHKSTLKANV